MCKCFSLLMLAAILMAVSGERASAESTDSGKTEFFERHIRPVLVKHCYACHSEQAEERQGGLLLDRRSGWIQGGDSGKAVVPGEPGASRLILAVSYSNEELQMPPDDPLEQSDVALLTEWVRQGAPGPKTDLGDTEFSRLGDQSFLFAQAADHWSFQPVRPVDPPLVTDRRWNRTPIDRFVWSRLEQNDLSPSAAADARTLLRRIAYDLTGLPPSQTVADDFRAAAQQDADTAVLSLVDDLLQSPAYGQHIAKLWLDVARYADTDSSYRPDTKTPHYFPFAFTYRDYVVDAFNADKPFDQFVREQLAADLLPLPRDAPEQAALGFLTVGPHANTNVADGVDDWIDVTTRGLLGISAACARCHDHKYEPVPTADYYALHGVFSSVQRIHPLDEKRQPVLTHYPVDEATRSDYEKQRAAIDERIRAAGDAKSRNNRRSVAERIRETDLAELLAFHPGAPVHTMVVKEREKPVLPAIFVRGDPRSRGDRVSRRFLSLLDPAGSPFSENNSGRLELADRIVAPDNPLTARVFVNRVWGFLMGAFLVETPSDFGLQGSPPTHPDLLDWLAADFAVHGGSVKHLVRQIVLSEVYRQRSTHRKEMSEHDPGNRSLWRANRRHLSIEEIRDSILAVSGQLNSAIGGRPEPLWGDDYTHRRAIYGYINRFNLDPTLRVFDFPSPMQSQAQRIESVVAPQALFVMNSPFVIDQAVAITERGTFRSCETDAERVAELFEVILQREPDTPEVTRIVRFVESQTRLFEQARRNSKVTNPWPLVAQSLLMSNEFQYID